MYSQTFLKLLSILLSLPVSTASMEHSFSAIKTIKTRVRSRLSNTAFSCLIKIDFEGPDSYLLLIWKKLGAN